MLIKKNEQSLKLLNGEVLHLHPKDKIKILKISTNIRFNRGIRLTSKGFDVNALLHEEMSFATLLPDRDIFNIYRFQITVKRYNDNIGKIDMVVEPFIEDWLDKAERIINRSKRVAILERALKLVPDDNRIRVKLVEEYKSQKNWPQAARMLEEMAKKKPQREVYYDLIEIYKAMSKSDGVISVLKKLIMIDQKDIDTRFRLASILEKSKRFKEAIIEYESILKLMEREERLPVYKILGYLYTETGQIKKAINRYLDAVDLDEKDVNLYYNLSHLYEKAGNKDKADRYLAKAADLKADDSESRLKLAERLIKKGELREAKRYLAEVLNKEPNSTQALLLMIDIAEKSGDKDSIVKIYRKILSLDPKNETIIYNLGVLEYERGRLKESLTYFLDLIKIQSDDEEAHGFLFDIYRKLKKDKLAFKEAEILIRLKPKELGTYHFMFEYLTDRKDYQKMIALMQSGIKAHPNSTDLVEYLILAYLKTGKKNLAMAQMNKLLKIRPKDVALLLQLGTLQENQGKTKEAVGTYKKIIEISPGQKEAEDAYMGLMLQQAGLQKKQGKLEQAVKTYEKIMKVSPGHKGAQKAYLDLLFRLAKIREKQGRLKEALKTYKKIMDISSGHEKAEEAYLRLRMKGLSGDGKE